MPGFFINLSFTSMPIIIPYSNLKVKKVNYQGWSLVFLSKSRTVFP